MITSNRTLRNAARNGEDQRELLQLAARLLGNAGDLQAWSIRRGFPLSQEACMFDSSINERLDKETCEQLVTLFSLACRQVRIYQKWYCPRIVLREKGELTK